MPKLVDGKWTYSTEEQGEIAMSAEARYQAAKRLRDEDRKEKQDAACAKGEHPSYNDKGKCANCGADKPAPAAPARRSVRDGLL